MHYCIALLHKRVTNYVTFLWKVMNYSIVLFHIRVTNNVTWLLFMKNNALQYCVTS